MITEDYVSFETAKLLKDKGFNEFTYSYYSKDDEESEPKLDMETLCSDNWNGVPEEVNDLWFSAPSLQMAMKWLREVHHKHCDIGYNIDLEWFFQIIDLKETVEYDYIETKYYHPENGIGFKSYEQTCEAAIKYCLENLI